MYDQVFNLAFRASTGSAYHFLLNRMRHPKSEVNQKLKNRLFSVPRWQNIKCIWSFLTLILNLWTAAENKFRKPLLLHTTIQPYHSGGDYREYFLSLIV